MTTEGRSTIFDRNQRAKLLQQGFTLGMIHQLEQANTETSIHIWILDNSASMNQTDGNRMIGSTGVSELRSVKCTRWEDVMDTAVYHAELATLIKAPTIFRLLNTCPDIASEYAIASQPYKCKESLEQDLLRFKQWLESVKPTGRTPLTNQIYEIRQMIQSMDQTIRANSQHVVLSIATDGLPSDERGVSDDTSCELFRKSLRMLERLPIEIIFRLSTDHSGVKKVSLNRKRNFHHLKVMLLLSNTNMMDTLFSPKVLF